MREKGGKVHSVKSPEKNAFGGQWTDERGGKVPSVKPLERNAFGGQWTDEKERWEGAQRKAS